MINFCDLSTEQQIREMEMFELEFEREYKLEETLERLLQENFDAVCRIYAIYLEAYENLVEKCKKLEKQRRELKRREVIERQIVAVRCLFDTTNWHEITELLHLSDLDVAQIVKTCSKYEPDQMLTFKLSNFQYIIEKIDSLKEDIRDNLYNIVKNVKKIISYANVYGKKLEFSKENPVAERILVLCYYDSECFNHCRSVIKIEGCKLGESFMKAYCAEGYEEERKAVAWFEKEAKKYKI